MKHYPPSGKGREMDKCEFILAYVLARAGVVGSVADVTLIAKDGAEAWDYARRFAPTPFEVRPHLGAFSDKERM